MTRSLRTTSFFRRPAAALLSAALCIAVPAGPAAATASAAPATALAGAGGWLRLAHFSPGAPAVDVYLYPFGGSRAAMVLKNVSYGDASPYESVAGGQYTVAMRLAGAAPSVAPVISSTVRVEKGKAYTVAGLGPGSALELRTLADQLSAPADQAGVRVIQASLNQPSVAVQVARNDPSQLRFPTSTPYRTVPAGATTVKVSAGAASTTRTLQLAGRSTHTLVVLSSSGAAPRLLDLTDSSGPATQPGGGVEAGLGGLSKPAATTAGGGGSSSGLPAAAWWSAALVLGLGAVLFAVRRLRRT
ncbi:DUF4397 domain-containing protein [Streptomyces sp. H10-C2]|uniref:DUF4397 domain-containing protein n=1 Tax=unclassified Streptomyces TaxID=2593676 RepID=UPI0024BA83D4|nr:MULTISPECIES: DUF4397 domain-containing protein [unclassified Streptomyces]MDJ0340923.1 DUF4397 domain-containing protein [Streptomyces sp. PH10-H1]MDJ0369845.1 DUF4397 domain-containing protein [Streptomyces sp. H10-C2]